MPRNMAGPQPKMTGEKNLYSSWLYEGKCYMLQISKIMTTF